jgi:glycosidase
MAALCQFSLSPTPVIYYGTEVGLSQEVDKDAAGFGGDHHVRADMPWDTAGWDQELLAFYQQLIKLRHEEAGLRHGRRQHLYLDAANQTYAYRCGRLVLAFNLSEDEQIIPLSPEVGVTELLITTGTAPVIKSNSMVIEGNTAIILR